MKQVFIPAILVAVLLASCTSRAPEIVEVVEVPAEGEVVAEVTGEEVVADEVVVEENTEGTVVENEVVAEAESNSDDVIADLDEILNSLESE